MAVIPGQEGGGGRRHRRCGSLPCGWGRGVGAAWSRHPGPPPTASPGARPIAAPQKPRRHPQPLGAILPGVTRLAFRRLNPDGAALLADWAAVVGPALAAVTLPRRLTQGTLTLGCAGPVAMELQHLAPQLIARINGHLGRPAVARLRLVQTVLPARPPLAARVTPGPPAPAVVAALAGVDDPGLRGALEKLAAGVYRKRPNGGP